MELPAKQPEFIAKSAECRITFDSDLKRATHGFKYVLAFSEAGTEFEFDWNIPNAAIEEVGKTDCIIHGPSMNQISHPGAAKTPNSPGTTLVIRHPLHLEADDEITLTFSFESPTGAAVGTRFATLLGSYWSPFEHQFLVKKFSLAIVLPRGIECLKTIPAANSISRSQIQFVREHIEPGAFSHLVLFSSDRKWFLATWTIISVIVGAISFHFLAQFGLSEVKKYAAVLGEALGLSLLAINHSVIEGTIAGILKHISGKNNKD